MSLELYFLRSSEQKIVNDMLCYAHGIDKTLTPLKEFEALKIYHEFYGLTPKDLGIYALKENKIAGAIWSRRLSDYHNSNAFVKNDTPVLHLAIKEEFQNQGIATALLGQYLQEAATLYELVSMSVVKEKVAFFEKFGFEKLDGSSHKSYVTQEESFIMVKKLQKQEKQEGFTDFSTCKWMD